MRPRPKRQIKDADKIEKGEAFTHSLNQPFVMDVSIDCECESESTALNRFSNVFIAVMTFRSRPTRGRSRRLTVDMY